MSLPTASGRGAHGHRTWLHLLPRDQSFVPAPGQLEAAAELLIATRLAIRARGQDLLLPGPAFAQLLLHRGVLPLAGQIRGEVRLEAGVLRCYPDPGPEGFSTDPPQRYASDCPQCGNPLEFFRLRFPLPDPMQAVCPSCDAPLDISTLAWSPPVPVARAELTFGDLDGRPSLRDTPFFTELEKLWATPVHEVHVTL